MKNRKPYIIGFLEGALDMPTFKDVIDALDEICATIIVCTGAVIALYMFIFNTALLAEHWEKLTTLIGIGGGYLFGKSVPKKPKD
ncbi:hypothetical protein DRN97_08465 [Methanosarcinales archaeon]|nr:MAG: hypothetical protein DRN97_08465 [Methanosarcinales archaeon]